MSWNKSSWVADKILAPFGMDELWEDQAIDQIPQEEIGDQESVPIPEAKQFEYETTITHLNRNEIEVIALTVIAISVLASSVPSLLHAILRLLFSDPERRRPWIEVVNIIPELLKIIIGAWLLFRSNNLVAWLGRWRELRMKD